jgi:hypothetical protein
MRIIVTKHAAERWAERVGEISIEQAIEDSHVVPDWMESEFVQQKLRQCDKLMYCKRYAALFVLASIGKDKYSAVTVYKPPVRWVLANHDRFID